MFNPEYIRNSIENALGSYFIIGGIVFIIMVFLTVNLKDTVHNVIIGWGFKWKKNYKLRDIIKYNNERWYIDNLNGIRIKFLLVIEWEEGTEFIILSKEELTMTYHLFQKSPIRKVGSFR